MVTAMPSPDVPLTREQATELYNSHWWMGRDPYEVAMFQLTQGRLCMPWQDFHGIVEVALGRPVFTHEFGLDRQGLIDELRGDRPTPTFSSVMALLSSARDTRETP